jgi:lysophospholipase L1-like esterase
LWVRFDGEWTKQVVDRDEIVLGEGAPRGPHRAWVVVKALSEHQSRWKAPLVGSLTVTGLHLEQGEGVGFVAPPPRRKLILEAIGDSITEGVLVHRKGKPQEWTEIADARLTYAFRTAEALGAEPRIIGFGRQGLTREGNGGVPPAALAYPLVYEGIAAHDAPADIVLINHGGNDSGRPTIQAVYGKLIARARERNPEADIFCVVPFPQTHATSVAAAVADARADGDRRVYIVRTAGWLDRNADTTDGVHPNVQGHEKAAKALVAFIREVLKSR